MVSPVSAAPNSAATRFSGLVLWSGPEDTWPLSGPDGGPLRAEAFGRPGPGFLPCDFFLLNVPGSFRDKVLPPERVRCHGAPRDKGLSAICSRERRWDVLLVDQVAGSRQC